MKSGTALAVAVVILDADGLVLFVLVKHEIAACFVAVGTLPPGEAHAAVFVAFIVVKNHPCAIVATMARKCFPVDDGLRYFLPVGNDQLIFAIGRSEERRVGKECRSR